ncbi:MAG: class I SAM-dependent DNA methyltransferase [Fulvivirga sp.]
MAKKATAKQEESLEKKLWKTADKLRKNMDAAEYKHVVLGLIFLKYISDAFEELYQKLKAGEGEYEGADPEDKNEYIAEKVFYVPPQARWAFLMGRAKQPTIGKDVDDAMDAIEKDNRSLKGVLPKVYARENLDKQSLGGLIDLIGTIEFMAGDEQIGKKGKDLLGHVYEYFLGEFALAEGKKGGQFYTPQCVVSLLVEMLEPYEGRVFDPCCGSGGMFVQSEKFIEAHSDYYRNGKTNGVAIDPKDRISIYGQESNQTTWRLCKMNLAIRGIDSSNVKWNNEGSFLNDAHKDLKADFILANPPFNDGDWSGDLLKNDARWMFGTPPSSNANFAWIQHFIFHLSPSGTAGFVLADSSMTSLNTEENSIRKYLIEADLVDCMITLPSHLFSNTQITACLWFIARNKSNGKFRNRQNEYLFIDGSRLRLMAKRKQRELSDEDILKISETYHSWRYKGDEYVYIPGFCKAVTKERIVENNYILSPNRYVKTLNQNIDLDIDFENKENARQLETTVKQLSKTLESAVAEWDNDKTIQISKFHIASQITEHLHSLSDSYYSALIKKYFIDFDFSCSSTR